MKFAAEVWSCGLLSKLEVEVNDSKRRIVLFGIPKKDKKDNELSAYATAEQIIKSCDLNDAATYSLTHGMTFTMGAENKRTNDSNFHDVIVSCKEIPERNGVWEALIKKTDDLKKDPDIDLSKDGNRLKNRDSEKD